MTANFLLNLVFVEDYYIKTDFIIQQDMELNRHVSTVFYQWWNKHYTYFRSPLKHIQVRLIAKYK
jgi:hypothetical protein